MSLTGWGRGSWNEGAWNESVPLAVTQSALTSSLGSVTVVPSIEISVTQSTLTSALGTTSFVGSASVALTQSALTSSVGSESVTGDSNVTASTNVGTGSIGNVQTPIFSIGVFPVGLSATGSTGEENVWSLIDTAQTANFSAVVASQTPNWNKIAA